MGDCMHIPWRKSDLRDYKEAQKERLTTYSKVDDILYGLCRKWPTHDDLGAVQAKVRIIGRVYMTGLERKGEKDKSKGIYETVATLFCKRRSWIDSELRELSRCKTLSKPTCEKILGTHGALVKLLRDGTKSQTNFRSFVSKYLHFHDPIVPIFDSRASSILREWYPWREFRNNFPITLGKEYDVVYYKFLVQFLLYFSDLREMNLKPSVRSADYYLIWSSYYAGK